MILRYRLEWRCPVCCVHGEESLLLRERDGESTGAAIVAVVRDMHAILSAGCKSRELEISKLEPQTAD